MAISYNAGTNTITLDGANTYTLLNIYNADVAGGWGVVSKQESCYHFTCNIIVGGGGAATKLIDEKVTMIVGTSAAKKYMYSNAGSEIYFKYSTMRWNFPTGTFRSWAGITKFEFCGVYQISGGVYVPTFQNKLELDTTYIKAVGWNSWSNGYLVVKDSVIESDDGIYSFNPNNVVDGLTIKNGIKGLGSMNDFEISFTGLKFVNCTTDIVLTQNDTEITLINSTFDDTKLSFAGANHKLFDKRTFNVLVTDKDNVVLENAFVVLKDKNGVIKHSALTGVDGKLPSTWEVLANRYDGTSETKTEYNPFTLTVTKAGYADYETKITIDHKIEDDQIALDALTYTYDEIMEGINGVASAVWDEVLSTHTTPSTAGKILSTIKKIVGFIRVNK